MLARRFISIAALASLPLVAACSGGTTTDAGTDTPAPIDVIDASVDATDVPADAADVVLDAADVSEGGADASDGGTVSYVAMVQVMHLSESCMPSVPADPLSFMGTVAIQNTGTLPLGPITASQGAIVMGTTVLVTFSIAPVNIPVIAPGTTGSAPTHNITGTIMPMNICTSPPCGSTVRVRIPISGPNVPDGSFVYSELVPSGCVF